MVRIKMDMIDVFTAAQIRELRLLRREQDTASRCGVEPCGICDSYFKCLAERIAELEKLLGKGE